MFQFLHESLTTHTFYSDKVVIEQGLASPFGLWIKEIEELTFLKKEDDIKPLYKALIQNLNETRY